MNDTYGKPVHEICVDKTSCRHEKTMREAADGKERQGGFTPTGHMTKDAIRKEYEEKMRPS